MGSQILFDYLRLTRRNPELGAGALFGYLDDVLQMPETLEVAAIVPSEVVALPLGDHEHHGVDPAGVLEAGKPCFLRSLHIAEYVATFECVAVRTDRAGNLDQHGSDGAILCGDPVCVSRHLGRLAEFTCDSLRFFQSYEEH